MPKVIHTATGPNGEAFKRTSTRRRYSHVVIARPSYEKARVAAQLRRDGHISDFLTHKRHAAEGYEPSSWMIGKPVLSNDREEFPEAADMAEAFREKGRRASTAWLEGKPATPTEYADQTIREDLVKIDAAKDEGKYDCFVALSWSGRKDLADREASRVRSDYFAEVRVIPVDPA